MVSYKELMIVIERYSLAPINTHALLINNLLAYCLNYDWIPRMVVMLGRIALHLALLRGRRIDRLQAVHRFALVQDKHIDLLQ